jgi:hypothetical protein
MHMVKMVRKYMAPSSTSASTWLYSDLSVSVVIQGYSIDPIDYYWSIAWN